MRRYLIVAHRTLGGADLLDRLRRHVEDGPCRFHLLVPVTHPADHVWTEGEVRAAAQQRLDAGLDSLRKLGLDATGEIGDVNPVYAVGVLLRRGERFDGLIVSTLPPGMSRWLKLDVPTRLARETDLEVEVVVSRVQSPVIA
jgi:hypothetical protein